MDTERELEVAVEDVAEEFLETGSLAVELIAADEVAARWAEPSVLEGYRVGGLAAHLARALFTVANYLAADRPDPAVALLDAPGYFASALGDHDPVTSRFHAEVRERGEQAADVGHTALVEQANLTLAGLKEMSFDSMRTVAVLDGMAMTLGEYLRTRLVELTIHSSDLAVSVDLPVPGFGPDVWRQVARLTAETALARNDHMEVALGLARPDRTPRISAF